MDELALDTETTGSDFFHGCTPYLVTGCDGKKDYTWEGTVDPQIRTCSFPSSTLANLQDRINRADRIIFHNTNFDRRALEVIGISLPLQKVVDTLVASHILCSGDSHSLKDLATKYFWYDNTDETEVQNATVAARALVQGTNVSTARYGHPHFPAAPKTTKWWKLDMWLAMDACVKYAKHDTRRTWLIWQMCKRAFDTDIGPYNPAPFKWSPTHYQSNNLWEQFWFRMSVLPVLYDMQTYGIHIYVNKIHRLIAHLEFQLKGLTNLIKTESNWTGYLNPDSPQHLVKLLYTSLALTPPKYTETGQPSTDKECLKKLFKQHPNLTALRYLQAWSECETELGYIRSYLKWATQRQCGLYSVLSHPNSLPNKDCPACTTQQQQPIFNQTHHLQSQSNSNIQTPTSSKPPALPQNAPSPSKTHPEIPISPILPPTSPPGPRLHSNVNLTGTDKSRCSSTDPNQQNFKKALHYLFGPPEGYYWLYMDVVNIELRIWAYDVGDKSLIAAFEADQSVHEMIAKVIRPHQIKQAGGLGPWKKSDPQHKQYTSTKAGTFTWINGGSENRVNRAYGISNAVAQIKSTFASVAKFFNWLKYETERNTQLCRYPTMFTIQGYPLHVSRTKPYIASSCRVQGTAGLIVQDMMVQVTRDPIYNLRSCNLIQQVHDSITFEIPQHSSSTQTNDHIVSVVEAVGRRHIPTCPMDAEVILPSPSTPFRLRMPTILPEEINGYTVSYFFKDGIGWIASGTYDDLPVPLEIIGATHAEARHAFISTTTT